MPYAGHGIGARRRHHHNAAGGSSGPTASVDMFAATGAVTANIALPSNSVLAQTTYSTITLEGWVKGTNPAQGTFQTVIGFGTGGDQIDFCLAGDGTIRGFGGGGVAGPVLATNVWTHIAYVSSVSGSYNRVLVNGVQQANAAGAAFFTLNSTPRFLGGDGGSEVFRGRICDLRVWSVDRTNAQILANYNKRLVGNETGLVGYWKMNENTGTTVADSTSGAATGTFSSATNITWVADMPTFV